MPKRLDEILGGQAKPKRRHLYLVLDDWSSGYSIRKIDLSVDFDPFNPDLSVDLPFNSARQVAAARCIKRLPPAIFRFQAQRKLTRCFAASFNSILAMLPVGLDPPGAHFLNVHKRTGRYCPLQEPNPAYPIYIPVDCGAVFALADDSFELLSKPFEEDDVESEDLKSEQLGSRQELESWELVWRKLPHIRLPFHSKDVTSYAVHSGEHTLIVSTKYSTFVYNTVDVLMGATNPFQWDLRHSQWVLPFTGRGHFDSELQAWIGLSREFTGHLCSCELFSVLPYEEQQLPAVKISKEIFLLHPHEKLVGDTLISCGNRSYYCLLQCISVDEKLEKQSMSVDELQKQSISVDKKQEEQSMSVDEKLEESISVDEKLEEQSMSVDEKKLEEQSMSVDEKLEAQSKSLLRLWTFYVVYDKNGDLTVGNRRTRDYILPESVSEEFTKNPVGFWM